MEQFFVEIFLVPEKDGSCRLLSCALNDTDRGVIVLKNVFGQLSQTLGMCIFVEECRIIALEPDRVVLPAGSSHGVLGDTDLQFQILDTS